MKASGQLRSDAENRPPVRIQQFGYRLFLLIAILTNFTACTRRPGWEGDWVMRFWDQNLMVLQLDADKGEGTFERPKEITFDMNGAITDVQGQMVKWPLTVTESSPEEVRFVVHTDQGEEGMVLRPGPGGSAQLTPAGFPQGFPPFPLQRPADDNTLEVGTVWKEPVATAELEALRDQLIAMLEADQAPRKQASISAAEMDRTDAEHRPEIERIHEEYGWPSYSLVGRKAAGAFFTLVQHQGLAMQQAWMPELEKLVAEGEASPQDFSLLFDRVMMLQGKPQRWGNAVQCMDGQATLYEPVEEPEHLDERRAELHLIPMQQYMGMMAQSCAAMAR